MNSTTTFSPAKNQSICLTSIRIKDQLHLEISSSLLQILNPLSKIQKMKNLPQASRRKEEKDHQREQPDDVVQWSLCLFLSHFTHTNVFYAIILSNSVEKTRLGKTTRCRDVRHSAAMTLFSAKIQPISKYSLISPSEPAQCWR